MLLQNWDLQTRHTIISVKSKKHKKTAASHTPAVSVLSRYNHNGHSSLLAFFCALATRKRCNIDFTPAKFGLFGSTAWFTPNIHRIRLTNAPEQLYSLTPVFMIRRRNAGAKVLPLHVPNLCNLLSSVSLLLSTLDHFFISCYCITEY